jgi:hypothetical protein
MYLHNCLSSTVATELMNSILKDRNKFTTPDPLPSSVMTSIIFFFEQRKDPWHQPTRGLETFWKPSRDSAFRQGKASQNCGGKKGVSTWLLGRTVLAWLWSWPWMRAWRCVQYSSSTYCINTRCETVRTHCRGIYLLLASAMRGSWKSHKRGKVVPCRNIWTFGDKHS